MTILQLCARLRMRECRHHVGCVLLVMLFTTPSFAAEPFQHFPLVISCEHKGSYHAFYFTRLLQDGTATYVASDKIAGTITLKGEAKAVGSPSGGSCVGKTLEQLRSAGQTYDVKH